MGSNSSGKLLRWLVGMAIAVLGFSCFFEFVYLPQRKAVDEGQSHIRALEQALEQLRKEDASLKKRLRALEAGSPAGGAKELEAESVSGDGPGSGGGGNLEAALRAAGVASGAAPSAPGPEPRTTTASPPTTKSPDRWRADLQCGPAAKGPHNEPAECDPAGAYPCCSPAGWCGASPAHCACEDCVDYRRADAAERKQASAKASAATGPYDELSPKRVALVVPFRDREAHLERFRARIHSHIEAWEAKGAHHTWMVFVVEQFDNELFNRGYLFNVGFRYATEHAEKTGQAFDCVVMHDIDIIPQPVVDYGWCRWPNQLSGEIACWSWSVPYPDNVGGVVSLSPEHWSAINGFSNEYEGWGGEDDDLYLRLKQNSLLKGGCHTWCKGTRPSVPMVYRPPLGKGRFDCLHDGDHTPRQRAPNDAPMWARLHAMKQNSKRWKTDGLSDLKVHSACPPLEAPACGSCVAPEDPLPKQRLFAEHWSRVSSRPIAPLEGLVVRLPSRHRCSNVSAPLTALPGGMEHLRSQLPGLFPAECGVEEAWANSASFALIDMTLGQVLLVGSGAGAVVPDSALPALDSGGGARDPDLRDVPFSHLIQSQRLIRWIRRFPKGHRGWVVAIDEPLQELRSQFVREFRRVPQIVPVCISQATLADKSLKYRATPGTKWCGDGGWSHVEYFSVLRSMATVPADSLVAVCISYNSKMHTYRFENSEDGCVGNHWASGTQWSHVSTIHSSKDAAGERVCVGMAGSGQTTRWMMRKQDNCNGGGFHHSFSFASMADDQYRSPLRQACFLAGAHGGGPAVRRLGTGDECLRPGEPWRIDGELWLLAARGSQTDYKICVAEGDHPQKGYRLWRAFWNNACDRDKFVTSGASGQKTHWTVQHESVVFVPTSATGSQYCLCGCPAVPQAGGPEGGPAEDDAFYSWFDGECPTDSHKELCFRGLSTSDVLQRANMIDEVA